MADLMMDCPRCWAKKKDCPSCKGSGKVPDQQLSPHFRLSELLDSGTGRSKGISNEPTPEIVANLRKLCVEALEPIRAIIGPMHVNSGYRADEINKAVGGSVTSAHSFGLAADIKPLKVSRKQMCDAIFAAGLKLDQVICEPTWVHIGHLHPKTGKQRGDRLSMFVVAGKQTYEPYNTADARIA
jgi:zinc D-Ala-D-Ala carboxypeptidase